MTHEHDEADRGPWVEEMVIRDGVTALYAAWRVGELRVSLVARPGEAYARFYIGDHLVGPLPIGQA